MPPRIPDKSTLKKLPDEDLWYTVFPKASGRTIDELDPMKLEQIGRLLARLHLRGESREAPNRIQINPTTYGREYLDLLKEECNIPLGFADRYVDAVNQICDTSDPWFEAAEVQRIHGIAI